MRSSRRPAAGHNLAKSAGDGNAAAQDAALEALLALLQAGDERTASGRAFACCDAVWQPACMPGSQFRAPTYRTVTPTQDMSRAYRSPQLRHARHAEHSR